MDGNYNHQRLVALAVQLTGWNAEKVNSVVDGNSWGFARWTEFIPNEMCDIWDQLSKNARIAAVIVAERAAAGTWEPDRE